MNLKGIFDLELEEKKEILYCENEEFKYWLCKDLSSTWIRIDTLDGEQIEIIHGDENINNKLSELMNDNNCTGGHKKTTYNAVRKIND